MWRNVWMRQQHLITLFKSCVWLDANETFQWSWRRSYSKKQQQSALSGGHGSQLPVFKTVCCRPRLVCLFLKRGADYNAKDKNQKDPITIAVDNANADIVTLWVADSKEIQNPTLDWWTVAPSYHCPPFQTSDRQDEQRDAGDGRSIWPIRSFKRAWIWGVSGCWKWAGPHQEESAGSKESYKWLGSGGSERLMGGGRSLGQFFLLLF